MEEVVLFCLFCFWFEAGIEGSRTFLLGFKMVPSLTCTAEPEAGDVRPKKLALAEVGFGSRRRGVMEAGGAASLGAGPERATDPATEASGGGGEGVKGTHGGAGV